MVGEPKLGLVIMGGACNCCTSELGLEVAVCRKVFEVALPVALPVCITEPPDILLRVGVGVPLRPLNLSNTVFRLFLLTEVMPPLDFEELEEPIVLTPLIPVPLGFGTGMGFSKLPDGFGAILGMVPAI